MSHSGAKTTFSLFSFENSEKVNGMEYFNNLDGVKCWDKAKDHARAQFSRRCKDSDKNGNEKGSDGHAVSSDEIWIRRYTWSYPVGKLDFTRALAAHLTGDKTNLVEELKISCIWYNRNIDGIKTVNESSKGKHDKNPEIKRLGKYS